MREIFFSVGEPSGDLHAANLIRALKQRDGQLRFVGYGGPKMQEAGCELHTDLTQLAVMWVANVIAHLRTFLRLLREADEYFAEKRPAAVILVDYPGFNWWIARKAKSRGIPVIYYGVPQLWAWAGWRVRKMRRLVDHALCKLPFEPSWFQQRGCRAHFVGHPYFDELANRDLDAHFLETLRHQSGPLLTLLPGSRDQEVRANLPAMLRTATLVGDKVEDLRVAVACFSEQQARMARELTSLDNEFVVAEEVFVGRTPELIEAADLCLACSGSVSLELMHHRKPAVIHYKLGRIAYAMQHILRTARYITLVNLLAAPAISRRPLAPVEGSRATPYPEFLTAGDATGEMADAITERLQNRELRAQVVAQLDELVEACAEPGASDRAAAYILESVLSQRLPGRLHSRRKTEQTGPLAS